MRYVALLRGVNVGGRNRLPMAEWRALLEARGLTGVATYIQSGNAVFDGPDAPEGLADDIRDAIAERFGFAPDCLLLTAADLDAALAANPFPEADADPKSLHLVFCTGTPQLDVEAARAAATAGERWQLGADIFYLHTPNGFGRSKLAERLPRVLRAETITARNLATCRALQKMANA